MLFAGNAEPPPGLNVSRLPGLDAAIKMAIVRVEAELRDLWHVCSMRGSARCVCCHVLIANGGAPRDASIGTSPPTSRK